MKNLLLTIFLFVASVSAASADILVLVHGYASGAGVWQGSGVNAALARHGWVPAAMAVSRPSAGDKLTYAVNLPANAPLMVQADILHRSLQSIRQRFPRQKLILAGHSAGGLVARLVLLNGNPHRVSTLITIATPHLGTPRAIQGLDIVDDKPFFCPGPFIYTVKDFFGGPDYHYLEDSRGVLLDLLPANSGSLIDWLNRQPHPAINYYSVVREGGDALVPVWSQDMNRVPVLAGRSAVMLTRSGHGLNPYDGEVIAAILSP